MFPLCQCRATQTKHSGLQSRGSNMNKRFWRPPPNNLKQNLPETNMHNRAAFKKMFYCWVSTGLSNRFTEEYCKQCRQSIITVFIEMPAFLLVSEAFKLNPVTLLYDHVLAVPPLQSRMERLWIVSGIRAVIRIPQWITLDGQTYPMKYFRIDNLDVIAVKFELMRLV